LILTHRRQLLSQWTVKLTEFLEIDETLPTLEKKKGRKKKQSLIGQIGAGKSRPSGIIDVAIMQSLNSSEVKEWVKNYGMVIVDECHHVPAFSFEQILKSVHAKTVYGLTATIPSSSCIAGRSVIEWTPESRRKKGPLTIMSFPD